MDEEIATKRLTNLPEVLVLVGEGNKRNQGDHSEEKEDDISGVWS